MRCVLNYEAVTGLMPVTAFFLATDVQIIYGMTSYNTSIQPGRPAAGLVLLRGLRKLLYNGRTK